MRHSNLNWNHCVLLTIFLVLLLNFKRFQAQNLPSSNLSEEDLKLIFGDKTTIPEFSLFTPKIIRRNEARRIKRRSGVDSSTFEFNALGQTYRFEIKPVENLISPYFALVGRDANQSKLLNWTDHSQCAFHGVDKLHNDTSIAIVMCGNLRGVVKLPEGELVIEPLPESVAHRRRVRRSSLLLGEHLVYRRKEKSECPWHSGKGPTAPNRDYLFSRYSPSLLPYHPSTNTVPFSSTSSEFRTNDPLNGDEVYRIRSPGTFYVETAVFVDRDLLRLMETNFPTNTEEQVIQVVLAMVNAVQLLYNDPSLVHKINYVLKRLELLYHDPPDLNRPHDIDSFLTKFCNWQNAENPSSDSDALHWDHALILTGLDLYTIMKDGKLNSQVVGLAPVAGMCTRTSSCTVNEGRHFESVYVVAHEIGHNLGMRHDGLQSGNNCDPSGYLMSPTLGSGKVTWSHCSKRYLNNFLGLDQSKCLRDKPMPPPSSINHEGSLLPGQRFSANQQCMLKNGIGSRASFQQPPHEVCGDLHCIKDGYTWTSHPALEGTSCGKQKWCRRGECVDISRDHLSNLRNPFSPISLLPSHERGGWGSWSECKSPCLYGFDGILSSGSTGLSLSRRDCNSCRNEYQYKVCSGVRQCSLKKKKTLQDYADEVCRMHSGYATRVPNQGIQRCEVECVLSRNGPMTTRAFFPDGTVCRSQSSYPTYCVGGFCTEFLCESNVLYKADPTTCSSLIRPSETPFHASTFPLKPVPGERSPSFPSYKDQNNFFPKSHDRSPIQPSGVWGPWVSSSECRFSCLSPSKGIQLVTRSCSHSGLCDGLDKNIQLCTPKMMDCDKIKTPFEYASEVCHRYSETVDQLSGIGMQLSSIPDDPNRGCVIACQDAFRKYRFYRVNGKEGWFPFGTECSNDGFTAFCLNGKCLEFSSDGTPLRDNKGSTENVPQPFLISGSKGNPTASPTLRHFSRDLINSHWRVKRNLRTTSHRLPGSFPDSFLLSLIDEFNATFSKSQSVDEGRNNSFVDLENPLFHDKYVPLLPEDEDKKNQKDASLLATFEAPESNSEARSYKWKIKHTPCSVTCGQENNDSEVEPQNCLRSPPHLKDVECWQSPCNSSSTLNTKPFSEFGGEWLMGISDDINNNY